MIIDVRNIFHKTQVYSIYIHFAISLTLLRPKFIKIAHDNWCPKQLSKSSSLLWYVQFAISLTFLRSIFMKITKNKRSSDSLVVDFLKIARRYFFFALIKLLILSAVGYGCMADILKHVYKGHLGPTKILRESQAKISKRSCLFAPFLYNCRLHIHLTFIINTD